MPMPRRIGELPIDAHRVRRAVGQCDVQDAIAHRAPRHRGVQHDGLLVTDGLQVAGKADDRVTTTIIAWDRYPTGWRNSPGMKLKLKNQGVVDYWRKHGFPPQCHALGADDFNCD